MRTVTLVFLMLASGFPARADDTIERGREMASKMCAGCHMNEGQGEKQGPMGVPSFRAVANRPGQTDVQVVRWLMSVPPMMPNHHLTQDEAFTLAAYVMSLRERRVQ